MSLLCIGIARHLLFDRSACVKAIMAFSSAGVGEAEPVVMNMGVEKAGTEQSVIKRATWRQMRPSRA